MVPEVSVVIPFYNRHEYIARSVQSVLNQTVQNFELIFVDDGSADASFTVVSKLLSDLHDTRIRLLHQSHTGVSAARNKGIEASQSELIAFLDSDDEWKPDFLKTILRLQKQFPQAGLYATSYEIVKQNGRKKYPKFTLLPPAPWEGILPNYFNIVGKSDPVKMFAMAVPKQIFDTVGMFSIDLNTGEDAELKFRIAIRYPIAFSHYCGCIHYLNACNRIGNDPRRCVYIPIRIRKMKNVIDNNEVQICRVQDVKKFITRSQINYGKDLISLGEKKKARSVLVHSETPCFKLRRLFWLVMSLLPYSIIKLLVKIRCKYKTSSLYGRISVNLKNKMD